MPRVKDGHDFLDDESYEKSEKFRFKQRRYQDRVDKSHQEDRHKKIKEQDKLLNEYIFDD